ncbi:DUF2867 domain-containing protein [Polaromonas sp. LjRoot131]|uniref:DUF2867 domain-containing protein n=1 Tax=Polaromonas sp. LjRoot131 TaxID=3342262 RepID=UPI003ECFB20E
MLNLTQVIETFPSVRIPSESGGLAVEVSLIAQIGHGAGNHLFASVASRQRQHSAFVDELDEPSAKLGGTNFAKGDATSLYSFVVGPKGHPFHRHAGHRIFTAVSGSGGAQLRFSSASEQQIQEDPHNFMRALRFVNIPPDCLFTVRFGGETWHQFSPLSRNSLHPVFFALSCHTNELGGNLSEALKEDVLANKASIPSLTELLPDAVKALLEAKDFKADAVPTTTLSLDAPPGTFHRVVCNTVRSGAGVLRGLWGSWKGASGFLSHGGSARSVTELSSPPADSLLLQQLAELRVHHEDTFRLRVTGTNFGHTSATNLLAAVLEGFLLNAPSGVSNLMALRNVLVKPLGLRTSPLGCPVSSLLSPDTSNMFANRYPVLDQNTNATDTKAQVILGANDKHLLFRSCVSVEIVDKHHVDVMLGTRVHCKNFFGRFYMAAIDYVHRHYVTPTMLRLAVEYAVVQEKESAVPAKLVTA